MLIENPNPPSLQDLENNPSAKEEELNYHDPAYQRSRREYVQEIDEIVKRGLPQPKADWETIWVLSGPETKFEDEAEQNPTILGLKQKSFNQTKSRFITGLNVAKRVAAMRAQKNIDTLTLSDLEQFGPPVYFNGTDEQNMHIKEMMEHGTFENRYFFPRNMIVVTHSPNIEHTGHQFEEFPKELIPKAGKLVTVTNLYHIPRVEKYFSKFPFVDKENVVLYPALPMILSASRARREAKNIYPYLQKGIL